MQNIHPGEITILLSRSRNGDKQAEERLAELILPELHRIASKILRRERQGQTLQTSDLVNEVYMKVSPQLKDYNDSVHFKAYAAKKMRWILIDRARSKSSQGHKVEVDEGDESVDNNKIETILALEESLDALKQTFPRAVQVVELRFYGGLNHEEVATALGVSVKTVKEDWRFAKAFLKTKLDSIEN